LDPRAGDHELGRGRPAAAISAQQAGQAAPRGGNVPQHGQLPGVVIAPEPTLGPAPAAAFGA
jgi:hypothetical protein